jgi:hypothetical protein
MIQKIPPAIIGLLSTILPDYHSHEGLNGLFLASGSPEEIPEGSKPSKTRTWLMSINAQCPEPLKVLASVIGKFMDSEPPPFGPDGGLRENQTKIREALIKDGLTYSRGGYITVAGSVPSLSLQDTVTKKGLAGVDIEIKRALENLEKDPMASVHNAGSVMEATFKAYLEHHLIVFKEESATLADLWKQVVEHMGIHPKNMEDKDLKQIASGLFSIVQGTMHLRNKQSAAHGKSDSQFRQNTIRPRHARLAIHAAHSLCAYVLECTAL